VIKNKIKNFIVQIKRLLNKAHRNIRRFKENNASWLASELIFYSKDDCNRNLGRRPRFSYDEGSLRHKRRFASELAKENSTRLLIEAAAMSAKKAKKRYFSHFKYDNK